jgi:hypothetical protein
MKKFIPFYLSFPATIFAQTKSMPASEITSKSFTYIEFKPGYGIRQFSTGLH